MKRAILVGTMLIGMFAGLPTEVQAGRPYTDAADMRPDILPHPIYNAWVPYRSAYNRPRFVGGYLAYKIEPTSQEAVSWKENYCAGMYGTHQPTPIKHYNYQKPWEALDIGPRYDPALIEKYKNDRPKDMAR